VQIQEMRAYIRSVVEIDSGDISDDVLNRFLGEGYDQMVYSEKRWPWYETTGTFLTVAAQQDYTLTAVGAGITNGLREIQSLRRDNQVISYVGIDDGDIAYPVNLTGSGNSAYWSYWGETVRLYPIPGGGETIYVRGYKNPGAFGAGSVDGTSPPDFPEPFHIVIATYGLSRAYEQQEDLEMGSTYYNLFARELDNLRARYLDSPAPQPLILNNNRLSRWSAQNLMAGRLRYSWE
jgi:hypothetical protein